MTDTISRINRAVVDCLILAAYSQGDPRECAMGYIAGLQRDPTWDPGDVEQVQALVMSLFNRLERADSGPRGWIK